MNKPRATLLRPGPKLENARLVASAAAFAAAAVFSFSLGHPFIGALAAAWAGFRIIRVIYRSVRP